jgi:hypothetical protein
MTRNVLTVAACSPDSGGSMSESIELVPFEGRQIMIVHIDDGIHVVMKPIVEALGLTWQGQLERMKRHPVISKGVSVRLIPSPGGMQEAVALHLEQFHGWLVTLSPDRITDEHKRAVIIRYQERAFRVIFEHYHGHMGKRPVARQAGARIALQNQTLRLTQKLQVARNPVERQMIHQMLGGMCAELGIDTPPLGELGHGTPQPPDILRRFWNAVETIRASGVAIDHSRVPHLMALSLTELREHFAAAGIRIDLGTAMHRALRLSQAPRYVADKTVNSGLTGTSKACWVFAVDD